MAIPPFSTRRRDHLLKYVFCAYFLLCSSICWSSTFGEDRAAKDKRVTFSHLEHRQVDSIGPQVISIQDRQGFMWFGGERGLARYDGYRLRTYRSVVGDSSSLSSNMVFDLFVDSLGQLWVGTGNGVNRYNASTDSFTRYMYV
ncbi:MAG: hypothetical protein COA42_19990, partial [Alteromonadaceae bacterium]